MIQFLLRTQKDRVHGVLTLRVHNRYTDFRLSCDYTIPLKDWSNEVQCIRCFTDTYPRPELNMMSYADLSQRMFNVKKTLELIDEEDLTRDIVRKTIMEVLHDKSVSAKKAAAEKVKPTLLEFIEEYIKDCANGTRKRFQSTENICTGTVNGYKVVLHKLQKYQKDHHMILDWDDVTLSWVRQWKKDLADEYKPNYICHLISVLKRMLEAGHEMHYTTCMDYTMKEFGAKGEDVDNIYLTKEMLDELWQTDFTDIASITERIKKIPNKEDQAKAALILINDSMESLQGAKHLFLVGCFTGQRISDYKRINMGFICTLRDGRQYIDIQQRKTKKQVFIPLDPRVSEILEMYNGNLPVLSDQKLNDKLKNIGLLMGWTQETVIKKKGGGHKKFYEAIMTHTARRTFATLAYEDGISTQAIMSITGHSSEDTFRKYIKTSAKDRAIIAAQEFYNVRECKSV